VLIFIGFKMLGEHWINQLVSKTTQVWISLALIIVCIGSSILFSMHHKKKGAPEDVKDPE
jgi:tellurite resistance protein TerC